MSTDGVRDLFLPAGAVNSGADSETMESRLEPGAEASIEPRFSQTK